MLDARALHGGVLAAAGECAAATEAVNGGDVDDEDAGGIGAGDGVGSRSRLRRHALTVGQSAACPR